MTAAQSTAALLRPWLGSAFVDGHAPLMERLGMMLFHFLPHRQSLRDLAQDVDSLLFMAVREETRGRMILLMDGGQHIRLRLEDFRLMADELLYLTMGALPRTQESLVLIRDYSMRESSLSALRALALLYAPFQSPEEYRTVVRVIKTCHPPHRWRHWLTGA